MCVCDVCATSDGECGLCATGGVCGVCSDGGCVNTHTET